MHCKKLYEQQHEGNGGKQFKSKHMTNNNKWMDE
jgi:hypothetical protein